MDDKKLRHAYLIMAHGNYPILEKQLRFLDSENADFFVHMDADTFPYEQKVNGDFSRAQESILGGSDPDRM